MVALLTIEKRRLLASHGTVTRRDFDEAWERSWRTMVLERSWAHSTRYRRASRQAMVATRREYRAAFLDEASTFSFAATRLQDAAANMGLPLAPEQISRALLAAIAYVEREDDVDEARASSAARVFVSIPGGERVAA